MSERKTLVGKAIAAIVELFKENWQSFAAKLFNEVPDDLKEDISVGIRVVENIKTWLGGDIAKFITHIIPGDLDEQIRLRLIDICKTILKIDDKVIGQSEFDMEDLHKIGLATNINKELLGLPFDQALLTTQIVYNGLKKEGKI